MRLVAAGAAEAESLAHVHALAFDPPWSAAEISGVLGAPGAFALLALDADDRPVGMLVARAIGGEGEILTIGVSPAVRRRGLGQSLVRAAAGLAAQGGAEALFLEVAIDNAAALALYESAGFVAAGTRKGYYDRGPAGRVDARVLRLDLNSASA